MLKSIFKKSIAFILSLVLVLTILPQGTLNLSAKAETEYTEGYYTYTVIDGKATITGYTGSEANLIIPSTIGGYPVTAIGDYAFEWCYSLESITIPNSVTSIGDYAFSYCESLISITIPNLVTSIGDYVFMGCDSLEEINVNEGNQNYSSLNGVLFNKNKTNLINYPKGKTQTSYTIPNSVTSISDSAFSYCFNLKSLTIADSVTTIGDSAFMGCDSLENIIIGDSVTNIGEEVFNYCYSLEEINVNEGNKNYSSLNGVLFNKNKTSLIYYPKGKTQTSYTIPNSVISIGDYAFASCDNLTNIIIPDSVTSIGDSAFSYCNNLESVVFGDNVTSIGDYAFSSCNNLESVVFGDNVTSIGDYAFYCCYNLESVMFGDNVTDIGDYAFKSCTSLESISISNSVTSIGDRAFGYCTNLKSINVDSNNNYYSSIDGILFNKDKTKLIKYPAGKTNTEYTIPNSVTTIGDFAFEWCSILKSITIPNSVTSIGDSVFAYCENLSSIIIPDSVTSIGGAGFSDTAYYNEPSNWEDNVLYIGNYLIAAKEDISGSYNIKENTKAIADSAFELCDSLESITIPDSVTSIGYGTFRYCDSLEEINVNEGNQNYSSLNGVLFNKNKTNLIYYPEGKTQISYTIPNSVTSISDEAFASCDNLTNITISDSVTSIGDSAFSYCASLTNITIPNSVTSIGNYTFMGCGSLESIIIGDSIKNIGHHTFMGCESLESIIIGDSVINIGDRAFLGCESLESITIPDSVTTIGEYSFYDCSSLNAVYYRGSENDKANIVIDERNDALLNATWYYNSCIGSANHTYDNDCDEECNICGDIREIEHKSKYVLDTKASFEQDGTAYYECEKCGEPLAEVLIPKIESVSLSTTSYTYNGKVKSPVITVMGADGEEIDSKYYDVEFLTSAKYVGEHIVLVTFKGIYEGEKELTFTIKPGKTTIKKLTAYTKSIKVYINKKTTQTSGYQVEWSTSKKFTNSKKTLIKKNSTTTYTIKSLSRKKTYYVRVRCFKTTSTGKRIYGDFTTYKYTKTK